MNRGYRFSAPVALANYYADVRNYANFNEAAAPNYLQRARQAVTGAAGRLDDRVQSLGAALGGGRRGLESALNAANPEAYMDGLKRATRGARIRGYGVIGAGALGLGAAGLAGAHMLRKRRRAAQDPEELYDPNGYMGGLG